MSNGVKFKVGVNLSGEDTFDVIAQQVEEATGGFTGFNNELDKIGEQFHHLNELNEGLTKIKDSIGSAVAPGIQLNAELTELKAITGASAEAMDTIEESARKSAITYGVDAANAVESYKLILSQLTPEIAKNTDALAFMGDNVTLFSKQLEGDVAQATTIATTAMNAYGISMDDPIEAGHQMLAMMDMMTQGAKDGSAELPAIADALENIGSSAVNANVGFAETNAAIQVLDKNALKGAQGGTALRNVLSILSQARFIPKDTQRELRAAGVDVDVLANKNLSLADRLKELQKVQGDNALVTKFFGRENQNAALALVQNVDQLETYTDSIKKGSGATQEFADIMMTSSEEAINRNQSALEDWGISIFGVFEEYVPFMDAIGKGITVAGGLGMAIQGISIIMNSSLIKSLAASTWGALKSAGAWTINTISTGAATVAQWALNAALMANPIGLVIAAIVALVAIVTVIIVKYEEWGAALALAMGPLGMIINLVMSFKRHWDSIEKAFADGGIIGGLKRIGQVMLDALLMPIQQLLELLAKVTGDDGLVGKGIEKIKALRASLNLLPDGTEEKEEAPAEEEDPLASFFGNLGVDPNVAGAFGGSSAKSPITDGLNRVNGGTTDKSVRNVRFEVHGGLVSGLTIQAANVTEGAAQIKEIVVQAMMDGLRDAEIAAANG